MAHDTKFRDGDESNFVAPFLIAFFSGMLISGFCAFLHVMVTSALVKKRLEFLPDPRRVKVKKGKKGKKKDKKKSKEATGAEEEEGEGGSTQGGTTTGKSKMKTAKEKTATAECMADQQMLIKGWES